jgi:histidinol-phosphate aminotransferase
MYYFRVNFLQCKENKYQREKMGQIWYKHSMAESEGGLIELEVLPVKYLSKKAQEIIPYQPGEQPQGRSFIKLNTNENPYPPSPMVEEQIKQCTDADFRLYPDPDSQQLKAAIAKREGLKAAQVFCSNGSDEVLAFCYPAFFNPQGTILFSDITYSFYPVYADLFSITYHRVPLDEQFAVQPADYFIENGGIIIANPNAPTGIFLSLEKLEAILKFNQDRAVVIVDEAYIEFGGETAVPLLEVYDNLLIIRTFSKSHSLAGLRVGYALGNAGLIAGLERIKDSFNSYPVDNLARMGAIAAVEDDTYTKGILDKITDTRTWVTDKLKACGFITTDSHANFIFMTHPQVSAPELFAFLREQGVLVRHINTPRIDNYLRVSIGTDPEMEIFLKQIEDYIKAYS